MRKIVLSVLDWFVVFAGLCLGICTFSFFGLMRSPWGEPLFYRLAYIGIAAWTLLILLASWFSLRHRKRGAFVFSICFVLFSVVFLAIRIYDRTPYPETLYGLLLIITMLGPPLVFGSYWWLTYKLEQPQVLAWRPRSMAGRFLWGTFAASALSALILCNVLLLDSILPGFSVDCGGTPAPFAEVRGPDHVVFTAGIVAVCCEAPARVFPRFGGFAIAKVRKSYGGLSWWNPGIVYIAPAIANNREPVFFDGYLHQGALSRLFSIVQSRACGRTRPLREAQVDLRVLRDGPEKSGVRILGRVEGNSPKGENQPWQPVSGETVVISGPSGTVKAVSDAEGIYDVTGLPPGSYVIRSSTPSTRDGGFDGCRREDLAAGAIGGCTIYLR